MFDIDMDDSGLKLKLPYNLSTDPYTAAQTFIHRHELSQMFLDEIAQFIITNTKGETITRNTSCDPFTGTGAYVAGSGSAPLTNNIQMTDPFTGGNAYYAGNKPAPQNTNQGSSNEYFPHLNFILFDQLNFEPIIKKIKEVQANISSSCTDELVTDTNNLELIENLLMNYDKLDKIDDIKDQIDLLFQMINGWPIGNF